MSLKPGGPKNVAAIVPKAEPDASGAAFLSANSTTEISVIAGLLKEEGGHQVKDDNEYVDDGEDANGGEDEELVENPSQDILGDMEKVLSSRASFAGSFSFCHSYPEAPNPALNLTGLGMVGVPLGTRDAEAIISNSQRALFGKGENTVIDKSVRDTWEMDAKNVHFGNPAWDRWLTGVVRVICTSLAVNHAASQPRCELYKLLLYETGSHSLPRVDTEKANGMFATIIVVLPSQFTGGAAYLSHSGISAVYDCSPQSLSGTTVMAWYTDVRHETKPITSGYRLALAYNLVHTTTSLRPALPDTSGTVERLRHVLLSWKQAKGSGVPKKIAYLLAHKYSPANSTGSAMEGPDAQVVAMMNTLAKEHGFHLGLANACCHITGVADDTGSDYYERRGGGWGYGDSHDDRDRDVDMSEVEETEMSLEDLVDLDGLKINADLDFKLDVETEAIPKSLSSILQSDAYDEQEYEGYLGNGAGSLERWYRHTALVIWPNSNNLDIMGAGEDGINYACGKIGATTSLKPTSEETELIDYILRNASSSIFTSADVFKSVCVAACVWRDPSIWVRAVKACDAERSITILGEANITRALSTFGFGELRSIIENALARDPSNTTRLRWLETFKTWVTSQNSTQLSNTTNDWVSQQRSNIIGTLKKPEKEEYKYLVSIARSYGGLPFLDNSILPQLKPVSGPWFLREFADYLHQEGEQFEAPEACRSTVRDLLVAAADRANFYAPVPQKGPVVPAYPYRDVPPPSESPNHLARAQLFIRTCLDTGNDDLLVGAIDKLTNMTGVAPKVARKRAKEVLLPLVASLTDVVRVRTDRPIPQFRVLCDTAVSLYVELICKEPATITKTDVASMLQTLILAGQSRLLFSSIAPKLEALSLDDKRLRALFEELHDKRNQLSPPDGSEVRIIVKRLVQKYAQQVTMFPLPSIDWLPRYKFTTTLDDIINALDCCLSMAVADGCTIILNRAFEPVHLKGDYIDKTLVPLVPELCKLAAKHQQPITSPVFAAIFRKVLSAWTDTVLGPMPTDPSVHIAAITQWLCSCKTCASVRTFLTSKPEPSHTWSYIGAPMRKHVEGFLSKHARAAATWETVHGEPQGITVTKVDSLVESVQWLINQKKGAALLLSFSKDTAELKTILGGDYARILTTLQAPVRPTAAATSAASGSGSGSAGPAQAMQNAPSAASNASIRAPAAPIAPTAKRSLASMSSASVSDPNAGGPSKKEKN